MNSQGPGALGRSGAFARVGGVLALAAATVAATAAAAVAPRLPGASPGWRVAKMVTAGRRPVLIGGIDVLGAGDALAGGQTSPANGARYGLPVIERWNGRAWGPLAIPVKLARRFGNGIFGAIGASSPREVWMVSLGGSYLRLDGARWTFGGLPGYQRGRTFADLVDAFSPDNVWAFGAKAFGDVSNLTFRPYAARFNGRAWTPVPVPGRGILGPVSAVSPDDMWAVAGTAGSGTGQTPQVLHWNGTAWRRVPDQPRLPKNATLDGLIALTRRDIWVGGGAPDSRGGTFELARHWNGRTWTIAGPRSAPASGDYYLAFFTTDGSGGFWATGAQISGPERFWHYSHGRWQRPVKSSWEVFGLAGVPGTDSTWGYGATAELALTSPARQWPGADCGLTRGGQRYWGHGRAASACGASIDERRGRLRPPRTADTARGRRL